MFIVIIFLSALFGFMGVFLYIFLDGIKHMGRVNKENE
jgi:hypothetical protein